jgi:hypothetical protein
MCIRSGAHHRHCTDRQILYTFVVFLTTRIFTHARIDAQGILFVTYSTSIGQSRQVNMFEEAETRVDQLVQWAGGAAFNGACVHGVRAERRDGPQ